VILAIDDATNRERLIEAYFAHAKAMEQGIQDDPYFWAVEEIWKLIERDPEGMWTLVLEMLRRADGDYMIAFIAAGPLEDFIVRYGSAWLERIEAEARTNAKFRRALVGVWGKSRMPEELVRRLRALVEGEPPL
jgi:hypothetical protein